MDKTGAIVEESYSPGVEDGYPTTTSPNHTAEGRELSPIPCRLSKRAIGLSSRTAPCSPLRSNPLLFTKDRALDRALDIASASPMSSPPPLESNPPPLRRKPAFSFLKRKRSAQEESANEPLSDTTHNVVKLPRSAKKPRLTQMQIDLGGEKRLTCSCGMEYIPSNKEDSLLHRDFHSMTVRGVPLGKGFLKEGGSGRIYAERRKAGEAIVVVDRSSSAGAQKKVRNVLEFVNTELSSADLNEVELWEGIGPSDPLCNRKIGKKRKSKSSERELETKGARFKAFLRIDGDRCVGFCLAEKISSAYRVSSPHAERDRRESSNSALKSSSISHSTAADVALLGISRIWTSKSHRSRGIATELLESARACFFYGMEVPKELVAFSQPTESGCRLAVRWFEAESGWHVYSEEQRSS